LSVSPSPTPFFISPEDLIKNKRAVGRDQDLLDAEYLERVKKAKEKKRWVPFVP